MAEFVPKLVQPPPLFAFSKFSEDARSIMCSAVKISRNLEYSYIATHHLFYALLEHNFATPCMMFGGFDLPIFEIRMATLRLDPPRFMEIAPALRTTEATWNCYSWAVENLNPEGEIVTPFGIYSGFLRFRESIVDAILAERGIRINDEFDLERNPNCS